MLFDTQFSRLNNKTQIIINFNYAEKLAGYNGLNYALVREVIDITINCKTCNISHAKIDNRLLIKNIGKEKDKLQQQ